MIPVTVNNEIKFGEQIYKLATERSNLPEGELELKGFDKEQFLTILKALTDAIDSCSREYTMNNLYLAVNFVGVVIIDTMEQKKRDLMNMPGGNA